MALVVVLPWPDPRVFPNYRLSHHWRASHKQVKAAREDGWASTLAALEARPPGIDKTQRIPVRVRFVPPDKRKRDEDGCLGAVKPYLDGIADALRVDDSLFSLTPQHDPAAKPGFVEVTIG